MNTSSLLTQLGQTASDLLTTGSVERVVGAGNMGQFVATELSNNTAYTYRVRLVAAKRCNNLRLWFSNAYSASNTPVGIGNAFDIKVAIELASAAGVPTGVIIPVYFGGARVKTVAELALVSSDPIGIPLAAGEVFFVRVYSHNASTYLPLNLMKKGGMSTYEGLSASGDNVDSGSITASYNNRGYGPCAVTANVLPEDQGGLFVAGTSIEQGFYEYGLPASSYNHGFGWVNRSLGVTIPYFNGACAGEGAGGFSARESAYTRWSMASRCRDGLLTFLTNDAADGVATCKARFLTVVSQMRSAGLKRVIGATILPRTTSTDFWVTTANQSAGISPATRNALNAWLRAGADRSIDLCLDIAAAVETAPESGVWTPGAQVATTTVAASPSSTATLVYVPAATFSVNQYDGHTVTVNGVARVVRLTGTNYVQPYPNLGGSPTTGQTVNVISSLTSDGTHPNGLGHRAIADAVGATLRNFLA